MNALYLNDGAGNFIEDTSGRLPLDVDQTLRVALVDVDGDTDLDLIAVNGFGQQNRLYLNSGAGRFTDATTTHLPPDTGNGVALATGDLDGDGDVDFIVGNGGLVFGTGDVDRVYLNNGQGRFSWSVLAPAYTERTIDVAIGDVDGDGYPDAVFYSSNRGVRLFLNSGVGSFFEVPGRVPSTLRGFPVEVHLADIDGDGDQDLVELDVFVRLYLNSGTGTFVEATKEVFPATLGGLGGWAIHDMDGDGDVDIVAPHRGGTGFVGYGTYLNLERQILTPLIPSVYIGGMYTLDIHAEAGNTVIPMLATSRNAQPFPPFGTLHLAPSGIVVLPPVVMPTTLRVRRHRRRRRPGPC